MAPGPTLTPVLESSSRAGATGVNVPPAPAASVPYQPATSTTTWVLPVWL